MPVPDSASSTRRLTAELTVCLVQKLYDREALAQENGLASLLVASFAISGSHDLIGKNQMQAAIFLDKRGVKESVPEYLPSPRT
eukprot:837043-Rhodomonas_salina.3